MGCSASKALLLLRFGSHQHAHQVEANLVVNGLCESRLARQRLLLAACRHGRSFVGTSAELRTVPVHRTCCACPPMRRESFPADARRQNRTAFHPTIPHSPHR